MKCQGEKCDSSHHNSLQNQVRIKILDDHHRVGAHVTLKKTLFDTLNQRVAAGCKTVQVFLGGSTNYRTRSLTQNDKDKVLNFCNTYQKSFYVHCPYVANLSRDPEDINDPNSVLTKSFNTVQKEINELSGLPGGCVLHIGSKGTVNNVSQNLNNLNIPRGSNPRMEKQLLLENSAGGGTSLGKSYEELRKIFELIDKNTIGLCIDTQHLFGAGLCSFEDHESTIKMLEEIEGFYGKPNVIHLNDSKVAFRDKKDRHESLKQGYIWNSVDEGLKTLLNYAYQYDIDVILETPDSTRDLAIIQTQYMKDLDILTFET